MRLPIRLLALVIIPWWTARAITTNEFERARAAWREARAAWSAAVAEARAAGIMPAATPPEGRAATRRRGAGRALSEPQRSFLENRRIAVSRDTSTVPGCVITTWWRGGVPDTLAPAVVTNILREIGGKLQNNPLQTLADQWRDTATNATARVERATAALDERRAEYVQKRDAATLPTTKAIYQAFIEAIDSMQKKLETVN